MTAAKTRSRLGLVNSGTPEESPGPAASIAVIVIRASLRRWPCAAAGFRYARVVRSLAWPRYQSAVTRFGLDVTGQDKR